MVLTLQWYILCGVSPHEGALHGVTFVLRPRLIVRLPAIEVDVTGKAGDAVRFVYASTGQIGVGQVEETCGSHGGRNCPAIGEKGREGERGERGEKKEGRRGEGRERLERERGRRKEERDQPSVT